MELTGEEIVAPHGGAEPAPVVARQSHEVRIVRPRAVRMDEIEMRVLADAGQERLSRALGPHLVPPDVRHLEVGAAKALDAPGEQTQPGDRSVLLALPEQDLQPEADAEV